MQETNSIQETNIIKEIEDMSLNAWPSHQMQLYDGWILRFSYFYTHRTNSVEQFGTSTLPWSVKIPYCERIYREHWHTPAIFKISPLVSGDFDYMLENRGYGIQHETRVMTMDFDVLPKRHFLDGITISPSIPEAWITGLFDLKRMQNETHRRIVPSMYRAIPKEVLCVSATRNGRIVATGLGVLDREYLGIYAIHVDEAFRRQGLGEEIILTLLEEGQKKQAKRAYLQVVEGNAPAVSLYEKLGFLEAYRYWFRVL